MTPTAKTLLGCPTCGSAALKSVEQVLTHYPVYVVRDDDGEPKHEYTGGDPETFDESSEQLYAYWCTACDREFSPDSLVDTAESLPPKAGTPCDNCSASHHTLPTAPCLIAAMVAHLVHARGEFTETEGLARLRALSVDAVWDDLGPILDRIGAGVYDVTTGEGSE